MKDNRGAIPGFRRGFTLIELLAVITLIGILMGLLLPAVQAAREAARRMQCMNNLKQIGLAVLLYDQANNKLPPTKFGTGIDMKGTAFVSILPYLEQQAVFDRWDKNVDATSPPNLQLIEMDMPVYVCPSMVVAGRNAPGKASSYALSTGSGYYRYEKNNGAFTNYLAVKTDRETMTSISMIGGRDGTTCTFLIGELSYGLDIIGGFTQWGIGYPYYSAGSTAGVFDATDAGPGGLDFRTWETFRSDHPGGVNFVFCDGHVDFVVSSTDATLLDNLANREDGKPLGAY